MFVIHSNQQRKSLKKTVDENLKCNVSILPTGYYFTWEGTDVENVAVGVTRVRENNRSKVVEAEIEVAVDSKHNGLKPLLTHIRTNLLSISARNTLVKAVRDSCFTEELQYYPWDTIIHQVCNITVRELRKGETIEVLTADYGAKAPEYLLLPMIVKNSPAILYAERSSAKSLFAILISIILTLPWHDNPFDLRITPNDRHTVLYLDWESDGRITGWQKERLLRGLGLGFCDIHYLHCARPLVDSVDNILDAIGECKADVVIIDSLGMAVGDDLNITAPAFAFWGAVRQLPVTPIILAHTSKDITNRRKTVYGNAYYEAEARSIWELEKQQDYNEDELTLSMFHRKPPPFAGYHKPFGFRFIFTEDGINVLPCEPILDKREKGIADVSEADIVAAVLGENDEPVMPKELFEQCKGAGHPLPLANIKVYLARLVKAEKVKKVTGGYISNSNNGNTVTA